MDSSLESLLSLRINAGNLPERSIPSVLALQQFVRANPDEAIDWSVVQETARSLSGRLLSVEEIVDRLADIGIEFDVEPLECSDEESLSAEPDSSLDFGSEGDYFFFSLKQLLFLSIDADGLSKKPRLALLAYREYVSRNPGKFINYSAIRQILMDDWEYEMGIDEIKRALEVAGVPISLLPIRGGRRSSPKIKARRKKRSGGRAEKHKKPVQPVNLPPVIPFPGGPDLIFPHIDLESVSEGSRLAILALRACAQYGSVITYKDICRMFWRKWRQSVHHASVRKWLRSAGIEFDFSEKAWLSRAEQSKSST